MIRRDLLKGAVAGVASLLIHPALADSNDVATRFATQSSASHMQDS